MTTGLLSRQGATRKILLVLPLPGLSRHWCTVLLLGQGALRPRCAAHRNGPEAEVFFLLRKTASLVTCKVCFVTFSSPVLAKEWACGVLRNSRKSLWLVALGDQERMEKENESPSVQRRRDRVESRHDQIPCRRKMSNKAVVLGSV